MSKVLKFRDDTEVQFTDNSTIYDCMTVVSDFSNIDEIREKFTVENLTGALFNGERITNIIPVSVQVSARYDENITVHFINRNKTHDEIIDEQIEELQEAIIEEV